MLMNSYEMIYVPREYTNVLVIFIMDDLRRFKHFNYYEGMKYLDWNLANMHVHMQKRGTCPQNR